jgi:hypothetical protein
MAKQGTTTTAGVAGAGAGTGLVLIAESLGVSDPLRPILLYLAPSASLLFGAVGYVMQVEAARLWRRRIVRRGRREVQAFLDMPGISDARKAVVQEQWEKTEQYLTLEELERMSVHIPFLSDRPTGWADRERDAPGSSE